MKRRTHPVCILLILGIFIWPSLMAFLVTFIGRLMGCQLVGSSADHCILFGINLGETISGLLTISWQFPLLAWFPFMWLLIAVGLLVLIHHELRGGWRLGLGLLSIWFLPIAPSFLASLYVARLAPIGNCAIGAGGTHPCWIFGVDMETAFATSAIMPWLTLIIVPVSVMLSVSYLLLSWLLRPRRKRVV